MFLGYSKLRHTVTAPLPLPQVLSDFRNLNATATLLTVRCKHSPPSRPAPQPAVKLNIHQHRTTRFLSIHPAEPSIFPNPEMQLLVSQQQVSRYLPATCNRTSLHPTINAHNDSQCALQSEPHQLCPSKVPSGPCRDQSSIDRQRVRGVS
jgi:hypothetical protein